MHQWRLAQEVSRHILKQAARSITDRIKVVLKHSDQVCGDSVEEVCAFQQVRSILYFTDDLLIQLLDYK